MFASLRPYCGTQTQKLDQRILILQGAPLSLTYIVADMFQVPRRVLCTGYGNGGAYAELCGIWAAVAYPAAAIRSIAFGAPVVRGLILIRRSSTPMSRGLLSLAAALAWRLNCREQMHCLLPVA